jgi:hypothetical protein
MLEPAEARRTLLFCTTWADSADLWRLRYGKWLTHVLHSRLRYAQVLLVDDGSPVQPAMDDSTVVAAEQLPLDCPSTRVVLAHFSSRLGRPATLEYPGWWRSFFLAAQYAAKYSFDKVIHIESDTFVLSDALTDYVNAIQSGWTALWSPYHGLPETCIQVIGADQIPRYLDMSKESYSPGYAGRLAETILPFTQVECCFKGDRYGEYRTDLPLDADWASQVSASTAVWSGRAPKAQQVLALSMDEVAIAAHPALYPRDAWTCLPGLKDRSAAALAARLDDAVPSDLDAVQLTVRSASSETPSLPLRGVRRHLRADGELLIQMRPSFTKERLDAVARSALQEGFVARSGAMLPGRGDLLIFARDDDPRAPALRDERLLRRLQLAAQGQGVRLLSG